MSAQSRKHRGYRTQKNVAEFMQPRGWPDAEPTGAGRPGVDVLGVRPLSIEVKARTGFDPLAWLRQAEGNEGLPFVVFRCNGQGDDAGKYPALIRFDLLVELLNKAGYGRPE